MYVAVFCKGQATSDLFYLKLLRFDGWGLHYAITGGQPLLSYSCELYLFGWLDRYTKADIHHFINYRCPNHPQLAKVWSQ